MIVLPSDHVIADVPSFTASLTLAAQVASLTGGLVTIGITPTRPETKYGYLEIADVPGTDMAGTSMPVGLVAGDEGPANRPGRGASILTPPVDGFGVALDGRSVLPTGKPCTAELTALARSDEAWRSHERRPCVYRVVKFTEKPDEVKAMKFLSSGRHLWNSGMFVWRTSAITEALSRHLPGMREGMARLEEALLSSGLDPTSEASVEAFKTLPKISVDYGVMEKASNVYAVKGDFGWDDVGTWSALKRLYPSDSNGNVILVHPAAGGNGVKPLTVDSRGCLVYANDRLVACVGVEDLIVVDAGDVVLVCGKDREHHLRTLL
ncbi:MAG: mannose-1-phosphate guanylyltransferase, partial [Thermoleophilia bacterium]|nr:mannose-1-phosphate guanylyltransferase [Thermoleophilia bacterium]